MQSNSSLKIEISVSKESYINKEIAGAAVKSALGKDGEEVRRTREKYGLKWSDSASYQRGTLTLEELYQKQINGFSVCNNFNVPTSRLKKDGSFGPAQKKDENFSHTQILFIDIDETTFKRNEDVLNRLSLKPSFWLTTYGNFQIDKKTGKNKGLRMRLAYALTSKIENKYFFRFCMSKLNDIILSDLQGHGEEIKLDPCNLNCSQYFNGTNISNKDLIVSGECNNLWYDLEDIKAGDKKEFISYLENYAGYSSIRKNRTTEMRRLLENETGNSYRFVSKDKKYVEVDKASYFLNTLKSQLSDEYGLEVGETEGIFNETSTYFLRRWEFSSTNYPEFYKNKKWVEACHSTENLCRVIKYPWEDGGWQIIDEDYFELFYHGKGDQKVILKDGDKRRKKLYNLICLRRFIKPTITPDEMVINILRDVIDHFDNSDNVITSDFIKESITDVFSVSLDQLKKDKAELIKEAHEKTAPKKGVIYLNKASQTVDTKFKIIEKFIDTTLTFEENLEKLNTKCGKLRVGKSTLRYFLQSRKDIEIKKVNETVSDEVILSLLDESLGRGKNIEILKKNNIKCKTKRLAQLLKYKKEGCPVNSVSPIKEKINQPKESDVVGSSKETQDTHSYLVLDKGNSFVAEYDQSSETPAISETSEIIESITDWTKGTVLNEWGMPAFGSYSQTSVTTQTSDINEETVILDKADRSDSFAFNNSFKFETPKLDISKTKEIEVEEEPVIEEKPKSPWGSFGLSGVPNFLNNLQN